MAFRHFLNPSWSCGGSFMAASPGDGTSPLWSYGRNLRQSVLKGTLCPGTWKYRFKLATNLTKIADNLTWFPLLLSLNSAAGEANDDVTALFAELGANKLKLAVTRSDGISQLYVEIERWNDAGNEAWLWVSKSDLVIYSASDTVLYIYYDNSQPDNPTFVGETFSVPAEGVWNDALMMVQHMEDGLTSDATYDSTDNENDGVKKGADEPAQVTTGKVAFAQDFDGDNDRVDIPNDVMPQSSAYTLQAWIYPEGENVQAEDYQAIIDPRGQYNVWTMWLEADHAQHPSAVVFGVYDGDSVELYTGNGECPVDTWRLVTATYDGTYMRLYLNGELMVGPTAQGNASTTSGFQSRIGRDYGAALRANFIGLIDDVKISNVARLASWIRADHYSQVDDLIKYYIFESLYAMPRHGFTVFQDPGIV